MKSQREQLLDKMEQDGFVNSYYATYTMGIKQAPTRIYELKKLGHNIQADTKKDGSVDWFINSGELPDLRSGSVQPKISPTPSGSLSQSGSLQPDDFIFTPDGRAILKKDIKPEQQKLI
jgi:hypothetical protein